jgi:hypothetical protein
MGKICPKQVEQILEINKTVIVASRWFAILHCLSCYALSRLQISNSHFKIWDTGRTDKKWDASMKLSVVRHPVCNIHIYNNT